MSTGSAPNAAVNCLISKLLHHQTNRSRPAWGDARPPGSAGHWYPGQFAFAGFTFAPPVFGSSENHAFIAANFSKQN